MDNDEPLEPTPEQVTRRFLSDNPDWLASQSGLYDRLAPPRRVHGDRLADHMEAMIVAARQQAATMATQAQTVLDAGRAARSLSDRVHGAVLSLIRTEDLECWIGEELPGLLGIDSALLCTEGPEAEDPRPAVRSLPPGTVALLLGSRDVRIGDGARFGEGRAGPAGAELHGAATGLALHDALLRVPARGRPPMLLALGSRNRAVLEEGLPAGSGGTRALAFLGEAVAARMEGA